MLYFKGQRDWGKGRGCVVEVSQLKIMPIVSWFKRPSIDIYLYPIPPVRSSYTPKREKRVIIFYTSQSINHCHHCIGHSAAQWTPTMGVLCNASVKSWSESHPEFFQLCLNWFPWWNQLNDWKEAISNEGHNFSGRCYGPKFEVNFLGRSF